MMWRFFRRAVIGAFAFSLISTQASMAQDASAQFTSNKGEPLIGEPFELTLTVNAPSDADITIPAFPSEWPPFMVRKVGEAQVDKSGGRTVLRQTLTVILWQPGDYQTPLLSVRYQMSGVSPQEVSVQPAFITVPSVIMAGDTTLRPLKPQVSLPYFPLWFVLLPAAGFVLVGVWLWSRRKLPALQGTGARADEIPSSAALLTFHQADSLHPPAAFVALSDGLRRYIERRFQVHAEEMTTEELARALRSKSTLSERRQRELHRLLQQADLVKFAPIEPSHMAASRALEVARGWVEAVESEQLETTE
jgi:hypothetical protein